MSYCPICYYNRRTASFVCPICEKEHRKSVCVICPHHPKKKFYLCPTCYHHTAYRINGSLQSVADLKKQMLVKVRVYYRLEEEIETMRKELKNLENSAQ